MEAVNTPAEAIATQLLHSVRLGECGLPWEKTSAVMTSLPDQRKVPSHSFQIVGANYSDLFIVAETVEVTCSHTTFSSEK